MITLERHVENKSTGVKHPVQYNADVEDVKPWQPDLMLPVQMKSMVQLNKGEKRFMVKQIWNQQKGYAACCAPRQMLTDEALRAIFEYLQWQYQMPEFFWQMHRV